MKIDYLDIPIILSLDLRGVIINEGTDTINRHYLYAKSLNHMKFPKTKYVILSSHNSNWSLNFSSNFFQVVRISNKTLNIFLFAKKAQSYLKENRFRVDLIVAGDCWENFWCAVLLSKFLRIKIPIQVQVHGDIANSAWKKINFKNRIRFAVAKYSLKSATSIRCVGNRQKLNLVNTFGLERAKIVSVPVPIIVSSKSLSKKKRPRTIGFLGRIHKDRGIWQFIELVEKLNIENTFFKVIVAGDGPERVKFLSRLQNVIPENRLQYLGQIKNKELQNTWKSIGVLVSMAPVESYGRVLRESLLAGVPVWATPSSGVYDLLDIAEPGTLLQIRLNDDSIKLNKEFEFLLKANISSKFRNRFIKENSSYAERLVNSWIATIETHKRYKLKKFVN